MAVFLGLTVILPVIVSSPAAAHARHESTHAHGQASPEKSLGRFDAWQAYVMMQGGQKTCYMVTTKTVQAARWARAQPYIMITHRPVEASTDVFSYNAGTRLDSGRGAAIRVGTTDFDLFAVHDVAWARLVQTDHAIAAALIGKTQPAVPSTVRVTAWPDRAHTAALVDVFDVTGAPAAYHAIGVACGLIQERRAPAHHRHAHRQPVHRAAPHDAALPKS
ncbi:MAG: hypothetical protein KGI37_03510 [Alphaproteobacteria bacterium]|nr:hypothetical protein [Alphaproteobacteria bacterium]